MVEIDRNPNPDPDTYNWQGVIDLKTPNGTTEDGKIVVRGNTKRQVDDKCMELIHRLFNTISEFGDADEDVSVDAFTFTHDLRSMGEDYPEDFYREDEFSEAYDLDN